MKGRDAGCKWAMLLAPTTFAAMLIVTVGIFAKFVIADAPAVLMGTLALILGALTLAGALFEWQWFFENRAVRGVRFWAGDQGTRWLYVGVSGFLLLLGFRLVGHTAMPSMAGKHPFLRMTNGNSTAESSTSTLGGFFGDAAPCAAEPAEARLNDLTRTTARWLAFGTNLATGVASKSSPRSNHSSSGPHRVNEW